MSYWKIVKSILPVSSRSFHSFEREAINRLASLEQTIGALSSALEEYEVRLTNQIDSDAAQTEDSLNRNFALLREQSRLRQEASFHDRYPDETAFEIRKRIFRNYPEAEGPIRLSQLANASIMKALHDICTSNGLHYWFAYGTLIATLGRDGSIPWDDDIDICMMRDDVNRLIEILATSASWQVTTVYDKWVYCKQYRFCSKDSDIPCFVDISIYDWATSPDPNLDADFKKIRIDLMSELDSLELPYWSKRKWLFASGSGYVAQCGPVDLKEQDDAIAAGEISQIESVFDKYQKMAVERGIICSKGNATAVAYAIDNIYDAPWRRTLWESESIFPTKLHAYERYDFCIPNKAKEVADECYPGWPYLPNDILGHEHFQKAALELPQTQEKLRTLIEADCI